MKIALIQQHATDDKAINIQRGLDNIDTAAANGAECAMFAELAFTHFFPQYHADTSNRIESESIPGATSNLFCEKAKKHNMVIIPKSTHHPTNKNPRCCGGFCLNTIPLVLIIR